MAGDYEIHTNTSGEKFWGDVGAGILPIASTGRVLVGLRSPYVNEPGTWGTFGGAVDAGEDPAQAAKREVREELGFSGSVKLLPAYVFKSPGGGFKFYNYLGIVDNEFSPKLDWETSETKWVTFEELQSLRPQHFGLKSLLQNSGQLIRKHSVQESVQESAIRAIRAKAEQALNLSTLSTLSEAQDVYFHATGNFISIVETDVFRLNNILLKGSEMRSGDMERPFYLSMSRVPINRYRAGTRGTFVLDGRLLNANYKIRPFEYWGHQMGRRTGSTESEDRLFSRDPEISPASRYIRELHISRSKWQKDDWASDSRGYAALEKAKYPVFIYAEEKDYWTMNRAKALTLQQAIDQWGEPGEPYIRLSGDDRREQDFIDFMTFTPSNYEKKGGGFKNAKAEYSRYHLRDFITQAESKLHYLASQTGKEGYGALFKRFGDAVRKSGLPSVRHYLVYVWATHPDTQKNYRERTSYEDVMNTPYEVKQFNL